MAQAFSPKNPLSPRHRLPILAFITSQVSLDHLGILVTQYIYVRFQFQSNTLSVYALINLDFTDLYSDLRPFRFRVVSTGPNLNPILIRLADLTQLTTKSDSVFNNPQLTADLIRFNLQPDPQSTQTRLDCRIYPLRVLSSYKPN